MTVRPLKICPVQAHDIAPITALHGKVFGPGRFARTAYRVREGLRSSANQNACNADTCSRVGWMGETIAASVTMTPITIGGTAGAYLLGPLVVAPAFAGQGLGEPMVQAALQAAQQSGATLVILVGDLAYYKRFGFEIVRRETITFPGPVDHTRILAVELTTDSLAKFKGLIRAENSPTTR